MNKNNSDSIIITGGAGFIGNSLVQALSNKHLTILDDFSTGIISNLKLFDRKKIKIHKGKIQSKLDSKDFKNCSAVFHLAGKSDVNESMQNPKKYFENNLLATINILDKMRKFDVPKIIFTSSSVVYGENSKIIYENYPTKPISIYGITKLFCEHSIESYCKKYGLKGVNLRLANIIGVNSPKGIIYDMIAKFSKNPKKIIVLGDGKQTKSYLHVDDCVSAIISSYDNLRKQKKPCETFNVSNNDFISVNSVVKTIAEALGKHNYKILYQKFDKTGRGWEGDITKSRINSSRLENLYWKPKLDSKGAIKSVVEELSLIK